MSKDNKEKTEEGFDTEEMTVELDLEDGTKVTCAVVTILTVNKKDYIALLPLDENGENADGEVWFYHYHENPTIPTKNLNLDILRMTRNTKP